jgi:hypothetical protein
MGSNVGDVTYPRFIGCIRVKLALQYVVRNLALMILYATGLSLITEVTLYPLISIGSSVIRAVQT